MQGRNGGRYDRSCSPALGASLAQRFDGDTVADRHGGELSGEGRWDWRSEFGTGGLEGWA